MAKEIARTSFSFAVLLETTPDNLEVLCQYCVQDSDDSDLVKHKTLTTSVSKTTSLADMIDTITSTIKTNEGIL